MKLSHPSLLSDQQGLVALFYLCAVCAPRPVPMLERAFGELTLTVAAADYLAAATLLRDHLLVYGVGGTIVPFIGIKMIDVIITALSLA